MRPDSKQSYGTISRFLHWSMVIGLAFMFASAIAWNVDERWRSLIPWHMGMGVMLLMFGLFRFVWMLVSEERPPPDNIVVRLGHLGLYALMISVPVIGLIRQSTVGRANAEESFAKQLGDNWHGELGWLLLLLIAGHIFMALFHQWRGEKLLQRMIGRDTNHK